MFAKHRIQAAGRRRLAESRAGTKERLVPAVLAACLLWLAGLGGLTGCSTSAAKRTRYQYDPAYGVESPEFLRSLQTLRAGIRPDNKVELLENGDGLFPRMTADFRQARKSINIELYIFSNDTLGRQLAEVLVERARDGVEVRVLVDAVGARLGPLETTLKAAGVKLRIYKPIRLYALHKIEDRTHRKIVVVDGQVGYCGGFCFDARWQGNAGSRDEWRDLAVRVEGPVVAQLQSIFLEDWLHTTGEVLHGEAHFPANPLCGDKLAQAVSSSRGDQASMSKLMVYMALQAARKRIFIANAYFVPDSQIRRALVQAVARGVDVRVVIPGPNMDIPLSRHASRYHQDELLRGGVKIYEYQPTMLHSKAMVVDGLWSSIGSINLNARSFKQNAEANVVIYDYDFARQVEKAIEDDIAKSRLITWEQYRRRGLCARLTQLWASLFAEKY